VGPTALKYLVSSPDRPFLPAETARPVLPLSDLSTKSSPSPSSAAHEIGQRLLLASRRREVIGGEEKKMRVTAMLF